MRKRFILSLISTCLFWVMDGINANKNGTDYKSVKKSVNTHSKLEFDLVSGGGLAMKLNIIP